MKIAVITANLENFDRPVIHTPQSLSVDYFHFNDQNFPPRFNAMTPRLQARIVKMFSWQMVPGYDYYLWIDSSCRLSHPDAVKWFLDQCQDIVVFKHPNRQTVQEEADYLKYRLSINCSYVTPRYKNELIDEQLLEVDPTQQLYASTAFMYKNSPQAQDMFRHWWYHTSRYHIVDQLSFPQVLANSGLKVNVIPQSYLKIPYLQYMRNKPLKIHVYSIMWNEEFILPYFLKHYQTFADKIFIINDHSSDKTIQIAKENSKVTLLDFPFNHGLDEDDFNQCFTQYYKKYSRGKADWVICVDADEIIYNKDILANLKHQMQRGLKIIKTSGYQMISENLPTTNGQIYEECFLGIRSRGYDKPVVFSPEIDIEFGDGRHTIKTNLENRPQSGKLALLHYRYLSKDYFLNRSNLCFARIQGMTKEEKAYRIKRGLKSFDEGLKTREKVI